MSRPIARPARRSTEAWSGIIWDEAVFDDYIRDPKAKIPGTKMVFAGIKKEQEVKDLTAFLKQFAKDGKRN